MGCTKSGLILHNLSVQLIIKDHLAASVVFYLFIFSKYRRFTTSSNVYSKTECTTFLHFVEIFATAAVTEFWNSC